MPKTAACFILMRYGRQFGADDTHGASYRDTSASSVFEFPYLRPSTPYPGPDLATQPTLDPISNIWPK